jgi:hypothetical protein
LGRGAARRRWSRAALRQPPPAPASRHARAPNLTPAPHPATRLAPQFNQHVIVETNKSTERLFPAVPDVESPEFFRRMDKLVELNQKLVDLGSSGMPKPLQSLARLPIVERMIAEIFQIFIMKPKDCGSVDMLSPEEQAQVVY